MILGDVLRSFDATEIGAGSPRLLWLDCVVTGYKKRMCEKLFNLGLGTR